MGEQKVQNGQEQDLGQLLKVRRDKLAELQAKGQDPFRLTKYDVTHHSQEIKDSFEELEGKTVTIAGRMMSKRIMGKASFCNVQDLQGNIQCYVARDVLGQEPYQDFKKYDIGDIIGVRGEVFRTKTGEISIHAAEITLLSKSLQILRIRGCKNSKIDISAILAHLGEVQSLSLSSAYKKQCPLRCRYILPALNHLLPPRSSPALPVFLKAY